jgi:hypothetical protein
MRSNAPRPTTISVPPQWKPPAEPAGPPPAVSVSSVASAPSPSTTSTWEVSTPPGEMPASTCRGAAIRTPAGT